MTTSFAGPVDRVHFADEQRRYRRKSWRFTLFAALAVLTTGIPACIVATPLIYAVVLVIAYIVNVFAPLSPATWASLQQLAEAIPRAVTAIDDGSTLRNIPQIARGAAVLIVPGALSMLALWIAVRGLVGRVGVGWSLDRIGARALNQRDQEEHQLGNLVEEIAVAAGVRPPKVLLIDTPEANAAITGLDFDDSTLLVTRGLLDTLDRDETQSVIAHLVGSVGNGDLKIASIIFSIYQTWGALALLLDAPVNGRARKAVWRAFKVAFRSQARAVDRWEAEFVSDALLRGASNDDPADPNDVGERVMSSTDGYSNANFLEKGYVMAMLPLILGAQVVRFAIFISSVILVGPVVSFMWHTRRHLADAMAVQLTRNPNSLVTALHKLSISNQATVKGAAGLGFLFIVWPGSISSSSRDTAVVGQFQRMHPKLHKRQRRLRALGATNVSDAQASGDRWTPGKTFGVVLLTVLIGPLMAIALGLSIVVLGMLTMLTLMIMMLLMFAIWGGLKLIFIVIPGWIAHL
ncbi:MAG TPA: M48 family metalloprotease [Gemmatimonadaceae bacterium]|nr:M48 family metalloprotease [Gemmatimonadaceae bacterium]